jgi:uncharacterized protein YjbI with pentapeptide repeats
MQKDYSNQDLRGKDFREQILTGVNFQDADIRGANFSKAKLVGAKFTGVKAGLAKTDIIFGLIVSLILIILLIIGLQLAGQQVGDRLIPKIKPDDFADEPWENIWLGLVILAMFAIFCFYSAGKGLETAFKIMAGVGVVAVSLSFVHGFIQLFVGLIFGNALDSLSVYFITPLSKTVMSVIIGFAIAAIASIIAVILSAIQITSGNKARNILNFITLLFTIPIAILLSKSNADIRTIIIGWVFAAVAIPTGNYIAKQALGRKKEYALVFDIAIILASINGTSFREADLTNVDFTGATLQSTDFRKANLRNVCWQNANKIDLGRVGESYLKYPEVQKLVVSRYGEKNIFDGFDLSGINLQGSYLVNASFIGANLNFANFQDTDLSKSKLKQAQLDGTDFTGATLTGSYIEDWNITQDTNFNGVRCEYVYMRVPTEDKPNPLRKPDNEKEVFQDGDFGEFIKPIFDTLDLYHNQDIDPRAIAIAYKKLSENNPDAELEIVAIEKRGDDNLLIRVKTAASANLSQLNAEYFLNYNKLKEIVSGEDKALIAEKDDRIRSLENMVHTTLQSPKFHINNPQGDIHVTDNRTIQMGNGDYVENVKGNYVKGNYYAAGKAQSLADAAAEIQKLLEQLSESYPIKTTTGKMQVAAATIESIEKDYSLEQRVLSALKAGSVQAIAQALNHPAASFVIGALEDWQKTKIS